jgi:hypothetical protein
MNKRTKQPGNNQPKIELSTFNLQFNTPIIVNVLYLESICNRKNIFPSEKNVNMNSTFRKKIKQAEIT